MNVRNPMVWYNRSYGWGRKHILDTTDDLYNRDWSQVVSYWKDVDRYSLHYKALAATNDKDARTLLIGRLINKMSPADLVKHTLGDDIRNFSKLPLDAQSAMLEIFPALIRKLEPEDIDLSLRVILACKDPKYHDLIDVNDDDLKVKDYRFMLITSKEMSKRLAKELDKDKLQEMFKMDMWKRLIKVSPRMAKYLNIRGIRNQTELRRLILSRPSILKYSTLEDLKASVIDGPTWVRIVTEMRPSDKKHLPDGFKSWAEREIFRLQLSGRRFKPFKDKWRTGL